MHITPDQCVDWECGKDMGYGWAWSETEHELGGLIGFGLARSNDCHGARLDAHTLESRYAKFLKTQ
jgi:hypothetical protein